MLLSAVVADERDTVSELVFAPVEMRWASKASAIHERKREREREDGG